MHTSASAIINSALIHNYSPYTHPCHKPNDKKQEEGEPPLRSASKFSLSV